MSIESLIRHELPLAPLTTLGVGGPARHFADVETAGQLRECVAFARREGLPVHMFGAGSNLLVADAGLDAVVLRWSNDSVEILERGDGIRLRVGAGCDWDHLVDRAVREGWAGIECLSGIPGSVGAAPIQNIGAYGQEVAEVIERVYALRPEDAEERVLERDECAFGYRDSRFKREDGWIVMGVELRLQPGGPAAVRYAELERTLHARGLEATLANVRATVLDIRATKGMILDPKDSESRSAGSFFTNPMVSAESARRVALQFEESMPAWPGGGGGQMKLSAAWLIERCGIQKGLQRGGARVSRKHVLALVNDGDASASDFVQLAIEIQQAVMKRTGILLRPEPRLVGFSSEELGTLG